MTEEEKNSESSKHDAETQALMDEAKAKGISPASLMGRRAEQERHTSYSQTEE